MPTQRILRLVATLVVLVGAVSLIRYLDRREPAAPPSFGSADDRAADCRSDAPECGGAPGSEAGPPTSTGPVLAARDACQTGGYLCAPLADADTLRIVRFPDDLQILTIRVPAPDMEEADQGRRLQRAAIRGVQTWQGHPFPIRIEERDRGEQVDMEIRWVRDVRGGLLGRTRSRWTQGPRGVEYRVVDLILTTRVPGLERRLQDPATVELTAAHEMGHALGLPHSDDQRDLMYPQNTSTHPTPRDYRTVQNLYDLPIGALVVSDP